MMWFKFIFVLKKSDFVFPYVSDYGNESEIIRTKISN